MTPSTPNEMLNFVKLTIFRQFALFSWLIYSHAGTIGLKFTVRWVLNSFYKHFHLFFTFVISSFHLIFFFFFFFFSNWSLTYNQLISNCIKSSFGSATISTKFNIYSKFQCWTSEFFLNKNITIYSVMRQQIDLVQLPAISFNQVYKTHQVIS